MINNQKVVWITGASSGIGKEMALQYAEKGYSVAVSARREDLLDALVNQISKNGGDALAVVCDVTDEVSIKNAVKKITVNYGSIDIAIANAGCAVTGFIENVTQENWNRQMNINVVGLAMTVKHVLPELKKSKGRLVLMGSISGYIPNPYVGAYGASKAAVHNIGETLQVELIGTGVSCTTIHPGFVDSNITRVDNNDVFHPEAKDPRPAHLMWPTHKAVKVMIRAIEKRKKLKVITGHGKIFVFLGRFFPGIARAMMAKQIKEILKTQ
ncbi:MAG TPA: SDR family NAD(P)-dependent oxidoreductase [Saprospiraceae bacterium]|nr:SDR family NAD(P)-dependent oxidoreductase [Saprospiraceae bacterium]